MSVSLRIVSVNIEGSIHLDTVIPFLTNEPPDMVCIQELNQKDVPVFEKNLQMRSLYVPMVYTTDTPPDLQGIGIFSRFPMRSESERYAGHSDSEYKVFDKTSYQTMFDSSTYSLAIAHIEKEGVEFQVGTTHMPVTYKAEVTEFQKKALEGFLRAVEKRNEIVFTGDFNAPRGGEIFSALCEKYKDNVPDHYKTSLDLAIHRVGKERPHEIADKMVDGIFSTPGYFVSDVTMVSGVSDHCALTATVTKV